MSKAVEIGVVMGRILTQHDQRVNDMSHEPPSSTTDRMMLPEREAGEPGWRRGRLVEIAGVFLKLGCICFGGPAAHVGLMEDEFVRRRQWLSHEKFADLLAAANLIPGPNSTEMAIYIGQLRGGWRGLVVAGACFIFPAMAMVMAIGWAYQRFGTLPQIGGLLYGVKPVMIAIVAQALWGLSRKAIRSPAELGLGLAATALGFVGLHELLLLLGAGLALASWRHLRSTRFSAGTLLAAVPLALPAAGSVPTAAGAAAGSVGLWPLFLFFLKVGAVLYGTGYVLLVFLRADLVERWHWLTEAQLLDAVAVGQITPGPLFTTATFIGYILGGPWAAVLATVGIFLPAFVFVALSGPIIPRLRASRVAAAFLDGVVVASLAMMLVVTWRLGRSAVVDWPTAGLALGAALVLLRFRLNSIWLVVGGAVFGVARVCLGPA